MGFGLGDSARMMLEAPFVLNSAASEHSKVAQAQEGLTRSIEVMIEAKLLIARRCYR